MLSPLHCCQWPVCVKFLSQVSPEACPGESAYHGGRTATLLNCIVRHIISFWIALCWIKPWNGESYHISSCFIRIFYTSDWDVYCIGLCDGDAFPYCILCKAAKHEIKIPLTENSITNHFYQVCLVIVVVITWQTPLSVFTKLHFLLSWLQHNNICFGELIWRHALSVVRFSVNILPYSSSA